VIDTGAARTFVTASLVGRRGVPVSGDAPTVYGFGIEGRPVPAAELPVNLTFTDGSSVTAAAALRVSGVPDEAQVRIRHQRPRGQDSLVRTLMVVYNGPEDRLPLVFSGSPRLGCRLFLSRRSLPASILCVSLRPGV
jgi:hypothetical protein